MDEVTRASFRMLTRRKSKLCKFDFAEWSAFWIFHTFGLNILCHLALSHRRFHFMHMKRSIFCSAHLQIRINSLIFYCSQWKNFRIFFVLSFFEGNFFDVYHYYQIFSGTKRIQCLFDFGIAVMIPYCQDVLCLSYIFCFMKFLGMKLLELLWFEIQILKKAIFRRWQKKKKNYRKFNFFDTTRISRYTTRYGKWAIQLV